MTAVGAALPSLGTFFSGFFAGRRPSSAGAVLCLGLDSTLSRRKAEGRNSHQRHVSKSRDVDVCT